MANLYLEYRGRRYVEIKTRASGPICENISLKEPEIYGTEETTTIFPVVAILFSNTITAIHSSVLFVFTFTFTVVFSVKDSVFASQVI